MMDILISIKSSRISYFNLIKIVYIQYKYSYQFKFILMTWMYCTRCTPIFISLNFDNVFCKISYHHKIILVPWDDWKPKTTILQYYRSRFYFHMAFFGHPVYLKFNSCKFKLCKCQAEFDFTKLWSNPCCIY